LAIVLTFNAPDGGRACVDAIQAQTTLADSILVVDNHSDRPVDERALAASGTVPVEVLRTVTNSGPAGGFGAGLEVFRTSAHRYAWVMDDDVRPAPGCLGHLLTEMEAHDGHAVVGPANHDLHADEIWHGWGWWGALIPRAAVVVAGVPDARLFWGLEDQEYLRDRLPLAGFPNVWCERAIADVVRRDKPVAAWKDYYLNRNLTYRYLYKRRHIPRSVRLKSLVATLVEHAQRIWSEGEQRPLKFAYLARGIFDGLFGRLGRRVAPGSGDRPWGRG
jgi:GT2 family glycosyltransferase